MTPRERVLVRLGRRRARSRLGRLALRGVAPPPPPRIASARTVSESRGGGTADRTRGVSRCCRDPPRRCRAGARTARKDPACAWGSPPAAAWADAKPAARASAPAQGKTSDSSSRDACEASTRRVSRSAPRPKAARRAAAVATATRPRSARRGPTPRAPWSASRRARTQTPRKPRRRPRPTRRRI